MKKYNLFYLLAFVSLALFVTSCDDDDHSDEDTNTITITIEEPTPGEVITADHCDDVHIHIDIDASVENHEVEVVLHPEGDVNDRIIDFDQHTHDKEVTFEQEVNLCSYAAGTCFHLEVFACVDHDCAERATADVEFCLE